MSTGTSPPSQRSAGVGRRGDGVDGSDKLAWFTLYWMYLRPFFLFFIFDDFYLHCEHVEEERWSSIRTVAVILDHKTKMEKKVTICWQFCFSHCVVFNQVNAEDITWLNKGK